MKRGREFPDSIPGGQRIKLQPSTNADVEERGEISSGPAVVDSSSAGLVVSRLPCPPSKHSESGSVTCAVCNDKQPVSRLCRLCRAVLRPTASSSGVDARSAADQLGVAEQPARSPGRAAVDLGQGPAAVEVETRLVASSSGPAAPSVAVHEDVGVPAPSDAAAGVSCAAPSSAPTVLRQPLRELRGNMPRGKASTTKGAKGCPRLRATHTEELAVARTQQSAASAPAASGQLDGSAAPCSSTSSASLLPSDPRRAQARTPGAASNGGDRALPSKPAFLGRWLSKREREALGSKRTGGGRRKWRSRYDSRGDSSPSVYRALSGRLVCGVDAVAESRRDAAAIAEHGYAPTSMLSLRVATAQQLCNRVAEVPSNAGALRLAHWGVPPAIADNYAAAGVKRLFPWQLRCLLTNNGAPLRGKNLVYSAPTSGGKTLVAEVLLLRAVTVHGGTGILVEPFVSLVAEKTAQLAKMWGCTGLRVRGSHERGVDALEDADVYVCTIERLDGLVSRVLGECAAAAAEGGTFASANPLDIVVVDELHMVTDKSRGCVLEAALAKIREYLGDRTQVVGLSATMPSLDKVANWLGASAFKSDFRPVPLRQLALVGDTLFSFSSRDTPLRKVGAVAAAGPGRARADADGVAAVIAPVVREGHSVLVFCATKAWCASCARMLAATLPSLGAAGVTSHSGRVGDAVPDGADAAAIAKRRAELLAELRLCPSGLCDDLAATIPHGVAIHHAGLTLEERTVVETGYRSGVLRVLVATSTLAAGVNLPARLVVIRSPHVGREIMDATKYRQMSGRAGRMGVDDRGESVLVVHAGPNGTSPFAATAVAQAEKSSRHGAEPATDTAARSDPLSFAHALFSAPLPPLRSPLGDGRHREALRRAVLDVIASGTVRTVGAVTSFLAGTLYGALLRDGEENGEGDARGGDGGDASRAWASSTAVDVVGELMQGAFVQVAEPVYPSVVTASATEPTPLTEASQISVTPLGLATSRPMLQPKVAVAVMKDLQHAREHGFAVDSELHLLFLMSPRPSGVEPSWRKFAQLYDGLSSDLRRVGRLIGVDPAFLRAAAQHPPPFGEGGPCAELHRRFFAALVLLQMIREVPLRDICQQFDVSRGTVQGLQRSAASFSRAVLGLARELRWTHTAALLKTLQDRLDFGVAEELLPLVQLPSVLAFRARALFKAKLRTPAAVAAASVEEVRRILIDSVPYQRRQEAAAAVGQLDSKGGGASDEARRLTATRLAERVIAEAHKHVALGADTDAERREA